MTLRTLSTAILILAALGCSSTAVRDASDQEKRTILAEMYAEYAASFPSVKGISAQDAADMAKKGDAILVDVREENERAVSEIPGAISAAEFATQHRELEDKTVIAYCTAGYRSARFSDGLRGDGKQVLNLEGGILAWVQSGQPIHDPQGDETRKVHVFGSQWNLLPEGYEGVW